MELENLVDQIAERVIEKLLARNRTILRVRPKELGAGRIALNNILDALISKEPLQMPNGDLLPIPPAITKLQLLRIFELCGIGKIPSATLTAALKARNLRPYISEKHHDARNRIYINGKQTTCYALSAEIKELAELLFAIDEFEHKLSIHTK